MSLSDRNMMKLGIGFTQETAEVSSPLLVYIDLLALLYILHASTMCCVVTVFILSNIELNKSKCCPALPGAQVPANADTHAEPLYYMINVIARGSYNKYKFGMKACTSI